MGFNRPEAKLRARGVMRGAYPHPMLVTLVYLLLTAGVSSVIMGVVNDPFSMFYLYMLEGRYEAETVFRHVFTPGRLGLFLALELLLALYSFVMNFGFTSYSLRLARGEQPGYRNLLDGVSLIGRVLVTGVLISVFTWLWSMLGMLPYLVVMVLAAVLESTALIVLAVLLLVAGAVFGVAVSYRYRLAYYFLLDNPGMGGLEAITHSKQAMKGWKGTLFIMDLSFLGWSLLVPLTLGILALWLNPYMGAAEANFYDYVVHGGFGPRTDIPGPGQSGGYGPNYGGGPSDPGQPF